MCIVYGKNMYVCVKLKTLQSSQWDEHIHLGSSTYVAVLDLVCIADRYAYMG